MKRYYASRLDEFALICFGLVWLLAFCLLSCSSSSSSSADAYADGGLMMG